MSKGLPLNGELDSSVQLPSNRRSPQLIRKRSLSQFPVPPGAPPWDHDNPASPSQASTSPLHRRAINDRNGTAANGRISPYTLSVAAEFSLKRANRQLMAMGETLESAKSELSPTSAVMPAPFRQHSRSSSEPNTHVTTLQPTSADGYSQSGDMLGDMRRLAVELRTLRESIDPARRGSTSSIASSRGSTPLTSPRTLSRGRDNSVETPRTSPRHSRQSSRTALQTLREEQPVIEVQTMRGSVIGQPAAVVRIFRSTTNGQKLAPTPRTHGRSVSDSHGISIRQYDYSGREIYSSPRLLDEPYSLNWRPVQRPDSEQSMISDRSYHTALQDSYVSLPEVVNGHTDDQASDRISDTATIGRPDTPVTEVRSIGVNTDDFVPAPAPVPPPILQKKPSRAALLSNIRGGQDGIIIARLHSAVDKLAIQLASNPTQNLPDDAINRQKLQAALDMLERD